MAERFGSASDTPASTAPAAARFGSSSDEATGSQTPLERFGSKMVEGSSLLSIASHPLDTLKQLTGYDGMRKTVDAYEAGDYKKAATEFMSWADSNPGTQAARSLIDTSKEQFGKAVDAFKKGDYPLVLSHGGAALLPILKPLAESAELAKKGDNVGAGGLVAGQVFDLFAPKMLADYGPAVASGTREAASATADNLTRAAAEHPRLVQGLTAGAGATIGGGAGSLVGLGGPGAFAGGYAGREAGKALTAAAKAKIPPPFPTEPPPLPAQPPPIPNPAANIDYSSIPGVGPRPAYLSEPPVDPALNSIARDKFGVSDFKSAGKALQELIVNIKQGQDATAAARAAQSVPPAAPQPAPPTAPAAAVPDPTVQVGGGGPLRPPMATASAPEDLGIHGGVENSPIPAGQELTDKLDNLLRQSRIEAGADPDLALGHEKGAVYQNRFGSSDSPVIDSSKRRIDSTAPIANPGKIMTKKAFRDSLPANSPLLRGDAFEKAYKIAVELKSQGIQISQ